jgi:hypothetical protein
MPLPGAKPRRRTVHCARRGDTRTRRIKACANPPSAPPATLRVRLVAAKGTPQLQKSVATKLVRWDASGADQADSVRAGRCRSVLFAPQTLLRRSRAPARAPQCRATWGTVSLDPLQREALQTTQIVSRASRACSALQDQRSARSALVACIRTRRAKDRAKRHFAKQAWLWGRW